MTNARGCGIIPMLNRGVAQFGRVLGSGPRGRWFKSSHSDPQKDVRMDVLFLLFTARPLCKAGLPASDVPSSPRLPSAAPPLCPRFCRNSRKNRGRLLQSGGGCGIIPIYAILERFCGIKGSNRRDFPRLRRQSRCIRLEGYARLGLKR